MLSRFLISTDDANWVLRQAIDGQAVYVEIDAVSGSRAAKEERALMMSQLLIDCGDLGLSVEATDEFQLGRWSRHRWTRACIIHGEVDNGEAAGVREPRRPAPDLPSMAAEAPLNHEIKR